ncbi:MAG: hypothetical protein DMF93_08050 [Acidobacteria bacterium]|nr:MAG: hypothetical protein DMF93_08050 [Acidobacteriota bacterium]
MGDRWLVATADYCALANEVRIYDPDRLKTAARTSEPGVLLYRFRSSPYVQTCTGSILLVCWSSCRTEAPDKDGGSPSSISLAHSPLASRWRRRPSIYHHNPNWKDFTS